MKKQPKKKIVSKKASTKKREIKSKEVKQRVKKTPAKTKKRKTFKKGESDILLEAVIKGIQEKKGDKVVSLNLTKIDSAVSNYFVVCEANSRTQVDAIAKSVEDVVKKNTGQRPYHSEGYQNAEWILIDYVDVVVHVFRRETRAFYKLEDLWADAEIKQYA